MLPPRIFFYTPRGKNVHNIVYGQVYVRMYAKAAYDQQHSVNHSVSFMRP